jgi:hypothetical protein
VDPVPDPLLLRKSGNAGNRTLSSGSVARSSDHLTTEAVLVLTYIEVNLFHTFVRNFMKILVTLRS